MPRGPEHAVPFVRTTLNLRPDQRAALKLEAQQDRAARGSMSFVIRELIDEALAARKKRPASG